MWVVISITDHVKRWASKLRLPTHNSLLPLALFMRSPDVGCPINALVFDAMHLQPIHFIFNKFLFLLFQEEAAIRSSWLTDFILPVKGVHEDLDAIFLAIPRHCRHWNNLPQLKRFVSWELFFANFVHLLVHEKDKRYRQFGFWQVTYHLWQPSKFGRCKSFFETS